MRKERWPLTAEERARLQPVIGETELPVKVTTAYMLVDESYIAQAGWAAGWWPRTRRVLLLEEAFEHASDEQLQALLARAIGHHRGYHRLLSKCLTGWLLGIGLAAVLGAYGVFAPAWGIAGPVGIALFSVVGAVLLLPIETLSTAAFSRWAAYDATRRGARLLGSTEPLEALYEPRADADYGAWWEELVRGRPHPSDHLDHLAALRDDLDDGR